MTTRYCMRCSKALERSIPPGDDRPRLVCASCGWIHYSNPRTVVAAIIEGDEGLLLCSRAIEPMAGKWTPPAGFLEIGESAAAGAARETHEEACAEIEVIQPFGWFDLPELGQVYHFHLARMRTPDFAAGLESLEVRWFGWEEIPWPELAFPVMSFALELRAQDRADGRQCMHQATLRWSGVESRYDAANYALEPHHSWCLS